MPPSEFSALEKQITEMQNDMREMRGAMSEIAKAMSKLAVLEEKNAITNQAVEKIYEKIDRLEDRYSDQVVIKSTVSRNFERISAQEQKVAELEKAHIRYVAHAEGIARTLRIMWVAFGSGVLYIGSQVIKFFAG